MKTIINKIEVPDTITDLQIKAVAKRFGWGNTIDPITHLDKVEKRTAQEAIQEYVSELLLNSFTSVVGEKVIADIQTERKTKEDEVRDILEPVLKPIKPEEPKEESEIKVKP